MTSVDGRKSYMACSDEIIQHTCDPCKDDGETKEAKYLCEFCKIHLCFDCRNDHKQFKSTKNHSIVSAEGESSLAYNRKFAIVCGCDQKRAVEVYCEKHAEVTCSTCETIKHRNCKTFPIKDKVTRDAKTKLKELMDRAKSLKQGIESCKQNGEENRKKLEHKKEECLNEITAFRRDINNILDNLEKDVQEKLGIVASQQMRALEKQSAALTASLLALDADLEAIDNAFKTNIEEIMFSANVKFSKSLSEYKELMQDIRNGMQKPKLEFKKNQKLSDMLKSIGGFGVIEQSEVHSVEQNNTVILDMKVKSKEEINIKLSDDVLRPDINGCAFLPNGQILLCDHNNKKVKLVDIDMTVKNSLKLSEGPYNVAAFGENEAVITFYLWVNDIQYIHTHPNLQLGKKITLPEKCFGLYVVNDEIYTTCHMRSGRDEVWRLDKAGNIKCKIVLTQSSSGRSDYLGLWLAGSDPRVYLTDTKNSRVTCLKPDGKIVYQYQDHKQLNEADDIYVDSVGNSLVCGAKSNNVVVITAAGSKHGELLTHEDITNPKCIDYRPADKTLIVGSCNSKLFVYKLGK